jgi:hypothetical protein
MFDPLNFCKTVLIGVLFCLLFVLLISGRYYLDVAIFSNLQHLEEDFEQQLAGNPGSVS